MKFKIDENLPTELAEMLRVAKHEAESVFDEKLVGESDQNIISVCQVEKRCLITLDMDFSDMRTYPPDQFHGLIVLRLRRQDKPYVMEIASKLVPLLEHEGLIGRLWIVEENRVRIRGGE